MQLDLLFPHPGSNNECSTASVNGGTLACVLLGSSISAHAEHDEHHDQTRPLTHPPPTNPSPHLANSLARQLTAARGAGRVKRLTGPMQIPESSTLVWVWESAEPGAKRYTAFTFEMYRFAEQTCVFCMNNKKQETIGMDIQ